MPNMPKRSEQRHGHRTKAEQAATDKAPAGADVTWHSPDSYWHPIAVRWYESLQISGQSIYYEQTDADTAYYVAEAMSRNLQQGRFSAQLFASVMTAMNDLLVTEGARRRAKLELQREANDEHSEVEAAIQELLTDPRYTGELNCPDES